MPQSGQSQEMLYREQPQQQQEQEPQQQETQPEEIKFANNGGGGPPKAFFRSFSSSSSVVCRPDPNNPGKQICKRVESQDSYDPFNGGHQQRKRESEEERDASGFNRIGRLFGLGDGGGDENRGPHSNNEAPSNYPPASSQEKPRTTPGAFLDKLLGYADFSGHNTNTEHEQHEPSKLSLFGRMRDSPQVKKEMPPTNYPPAWTQADFQTDDHFHDPFEVMNEIERMMGFGGRGMLGGFGFPRDDFISSIQREMFDDSFFDGPRHHGHGGFGHFGDPSNFQGSHSSFHSGGFGGGFPGGGFGGNFQPFEDDRRFSRRGDEPGFRKFSRQPAQQQYQSQVNPSAAALSQDDSNFKSNFKQPSQQPEFRSNFTQVNQGPSEGQVRFTGKIYDV